MSCDRYRDEVADAAAGAEATSELKAHLERCEACRREFETRREALARADAELSSLLAMEASPDLSTRIRRAVAADEGPGWWPRRVRPALAVAAALVIALGAAAIWRGASRPFVPEASPLTRLEPPPEPGLREHRPSPALTARTALAAPAAGERTPSERVPAPTEPPGPEPPHVPSSGPLEPEVLVPMGQEEALLRFASELQSRSVTPDSLLVAEPSAPLNEPRPLHRVEIEILTLDSSLVSGL